MLIEVKLSVNITSFIVQICNMLIEVELLSIITDRSFSKLEFSFEESANECFVCHLNTGEKMALTLVCFHAVFMVVA